MRELKDVFFEILRESKSKDGLTFEIVIIREGKSKNGTYYPKETLLASREKFEGARVAYYEWNGMWDHLSEEQRAKVPEGFPSKVAGLVTDVRFKKLDSGEYGLVGNLKLTESNRWLADIFKLGLQSGNRDVLGFSIDVLGECVREKVGSEEVDVVKDIGVVNEITVVTNPAAGGRLERMVASVQLKKEGKEMRDELLKLIATLMPKKLDGVSFTEAEEPKIKELAVETANELKAPLSEADPMHGLLTELVAAVQGGDMKKVLQCAQDIVNIHSKGEKVTEAEQKAAEEKAAAEKAEADKKANEGATDVTELKAKQEATEKRISESEKRICEATLRAALAESKLPEAAKTRIKERFTGKTFDEADLSKEIEAEVKYLASLTESLHPNGLHVEMNEIPADKLGDAIEGMIADKDINKQPRFRSIHEAFAKTEKISPFASGFKDRLWIGMVRGAAVVDQKRAMKEAIQTSTFGEILGDRLNKRMVAEYQEVGLDDWRKVASIASQKDFLTNRITRLGGYGATLAAVNEAAAYQAVTSPTDEEATYAVTKRGGLETISMEAIKNDNLRALQMIPKRLGRSAKSTLYAFVFEMLNPATNAAVYDTVTLYHANHGGNLGTTALSYAQFNSAAVIMMDQTGYNEANFFLQSPPKYLLVPNELWMTAQEIAKSNVSANAARTETLPNVFSEWNLEVIRMASWTDANNWAMLADPSKFPGLEIGFLDGNEEPELLQEAANSGSDFTNDQIRYKLRHIYGGAVADWRPFYGAVVA